MARTVYQSERAAFSQRAHKAARRLVYPHVFQSSAGCLHYEEVDKHTDERNRILDCEMGIDKIVCVSVSRLQAPLGFTVQERFREPEWADKRDITVTEWNQASGLPSELYKLRAQLFLYGYYDEYQDIFLEVLCVNVAWLLHGLVTKTIPYKIEENRKLQTFLGLKFDDLKKGQVVMYHKRYRPDPMNFIVGANGQIKIDLEDLTDEDADAAYREEDSNE